MPEVAQGKVGHLEALILEGTTYRFRSDDGMNGEGFQIEYSTIKTY